MHITFLIVPFDNEGVAETVCNLDQLNLSLQTLTNFD